jgi:hypothetical protein
MYWQFSINYLACFDAYVCSADVVVAIVVVKVKLFPTRYGLSSVLYRTLLADYETLSCLLCILKAAVAIARTVTLIFSIQNCGRSWSFCDRLGSFRHSRGMVFTSQGFNA